MKSDVKAQMAAPQSLKMNHLRVRRNRAQVLENEWNRINRRNQDLLSRIMTIHNKNTDSDIKVAVANHRRFARGSTASQLASRGKMLEKSRQETYRMNTILGCKFRDAKSRITVFADPGMNTGLEKDHRERPKPTLRPLTLRSPAKGYLPPPRSAGTLYPKFRTSVQHKAMQARTAHPFT